MIVVLPKIALGVACGLFLCYKMMPVILDQPEHAKYHGPAFRVDHRQQRTQWLEDNTVLSEEARKVCVAFGGKMQTLCLEVSPEDPSDWMSSDSQGVPISHIVPDYDSRLKPF